MADENTSSKKDKKIIVERWGPQNVGYDSFKKIVNSLHVLRADTKKVMLSSISSTAGFQPKTISSAMQFLDSIRIIEGDKNLGYSVTIEGQKFVKSIVQKDVPALKGETRRIIDSSFLQKLKNYITVNKEELSLEKLYRYVASEARYGEGNGPFKLHQPHFTGIRTLLQIFKDAEYLEANFSLDAPHGPKQGSSKKPQQDNKKQKGQQNEKIRKEVKGTSQVTNESRHTLQSDNFILSYNKEMDDDTFEHMKNQIESELSFRAKKRKVKSE